VDLLDVISSHRSIRRYRDESVPENHVEIILEAARRAPTSYNLMPVSIIAVTDPVLREKLAEAVGRQEHVASAPLFLVFTVDYAKMVEAARHIGVEFSQPGLGHLVPALLDVGIMSGWAALAAERLGYGITFIALYSNPCGVAKILGLPGLVLPVVGITVGLPAESPELRPRHPPSAVYSENKYCPGPRERGVKVAETYGGRVRRLFEAVLKPGSYYDRVSEAFTRCMEQRGFKV
jgi:FMN reductase [NAD(P)H]